MRDLHVLPRTRDSLSFLYVEHWRVGLEAYAIAVVDAGGRVPVPCASLSVLLLGPGTTTTHAAVRALADSGCLAVWTGEQGVRTYAVGSCETRSARNLLRQARARADPAAHARVARRLYELRFDEPLALRLGTYCARLGRHARDAPRCNKSHAAAGHKSQTFRVGPGTLGTRTREPSEWAGEGARAESGRHAPLGKVE